MQTTNTQDVLARLREAANAAAEQSDDMNEAVAGGGSRVLPEGYAMARLVQYIELGDHAGEYKGKKKDPARLFRLAFALYGEQYANEDGSPYLMRTYDLRLLRNEKAGAYTLFKKMNYSQQATTYAQLIGNGYLIPIVNVSKKVDGKETGELYSRVDLANILPPFDPITKATYPIPDVRAEDLALFLYDFPTQESWDALFIDGQRDDGKSKNWVQEKILSSTSFTGSALERLLLGAVVPPLPTEADPPQNDAAAETAVKAKRVRKPQEKPPVNPGGVKTPTIPNVPTLPPLPTLPKD